MTDRLNTSLLKLNMDFIAAKSFLDNLYINSIKKELVNNMLETNDISEGIRSLNNTSINTSCFAKFNNEAKVKVNNNFYDQNTRKCYKNTNLIQSLNYVYPTKVKTVVDSNAHLESNNNIKLSLYNIIDNLNQSFVNNKELQFKDELNKKISSLKQESLSRLIGSNYLNNLDNYTNNNYKYNNIGTNGRSNLFIGNKRNIDHRYQNISNLSNDTFNTINSDIYSELSNSFNFNANFNIDQDHNLNKNLNKKYPKEMMNPSFNNSLSPNKCMNNVNNLDNSKGNTRHLSNNDINNYSNDQSNSQRMSFVKSIPSTLDSSSSFNNNSNVNNNNNIININNNIISNNIKDDIPLKENMLDQIYFNKEDNNNLRLNNDNNYGLNAYDDEDTEKIEISNLDFFNLIKEGINNNSSFNNHINSNHYAEERIPFKNGNICNENRFSYINNNIGRNSNRRVQTTEDKNIKNCIYNTDNNKSSTVTKIKSSLKLEVFKRNSNSEIELIKKESTNINTDNKIKTTTDISNNWIRTNTIPVLPKEYSPHNLENPFANIIFSNIKSTKQNYRSDCIRKRIKTFVNNYIINKLNEITKIYDNSIFLLRLPKELIVNIRMDLNNKILKLTIKELFCYKTNQQEDERINHNTKMMNLIENKYFVKYVNLPFKEVFKEYTLSNQYIIDLQKLASSETKEYVLIYQQHVDEFLNYYRIF